MRIRDADVSPIDRTSARVPDDVRGVLFRALARDPMLRWPTAGAFAEAIEDIVRRRRLQVGPSRLAVFVEKLGLVTGPDVEEETRETAAATTPLESDTSPGWCLPASTACSGKTGRSWARSGCPG
jgi:hypothetical protein